MPWHIESEHPSCPVGRPFGVVKDADGEVEGCHPTKAAAQKQLAALYAQEHEMDSAPPSDNLSRAVDFALDEHADGNTLVGYAAVFDTPYRIDSWEGMFDEIIAPGAFKRTINARTPVLQFDHGSHPMLGSIPLGRIDTLREDRRGLYVEARLADNWLVEPVRDAIRDGAISGMSFRFNVVADEWDESDDIPVRTIREVKLHELGPVVFPASPTTSVGVRSLLRDPELLHELARALLNGTSEEPATGTSDEPAGDDPVSSLLTARQLRQRWQRVRASTALKE